MNGPDGPKPAGPPDLPPGGQPGGSVDVGEKVGRGTTIFLALAAGLVVLAEKLRKKAKAKNIFVTLNKEGLLIHADGMGKAAYFTDRLEAMNKAPVDPAGAGDSLLTCAAMALAAGGDIWQSAYLGSVAAACQVSRNGNIPLSVSELSQRSHL